MKKKVISALLGFILIFSLGVSSASVLSTGENLPPVHKMSLEKVVL